MDSTKYFNNLKVNITGVVLAGGESRRMGEDKSVMLFQQQKLIEYSLNALVPFCETIFISSNKLIHKEFPYPQIKDEFQKIGPIGGIHSALKVSKTDYILILPCDSPMVSQDFLRFLISNIEENKQCSIIPKNNHHLEPLFAIYHKSILPIVEQQIENGDYKLNHLIGKIEVKNITIKEVNTFININTPEDFCNFKGD